MINHQETNQSQFEVKPQSVMVVLRGITPIDQVVRGDQGCNHRRPHNAAVELALHNFKTLVADGIVTHRVINK